VVFATGAGDLGGTVLFASLTGDLGAEGH